MLHYALSFPGCILLPSPDLLCNGVMCGFDGKSYERPHKTRQLKLVMNCHLAPFISVSAIRKISLWNDLLLFSKEVLLSCRITLKDLRRNKRVGFKYSINWATSDVPLVPSNTSNLQKSIALMMFHFLKTTTNYFLLHIQNISYKYTCCYI